MNVASPDRDLALSPDGRHLVYRFGGATTVGGPLMVRAIDQVDPLQLAGTANVYTPFISHDNQWIGFFEDGELKKVPIAGGPVVSLVRCERGATWGQLGRWEHDRVRHRRREHRPVADLAEGGEPRILTTPDTAKREVDHLFPSVLPGGRGVLFTITTAAQADNAEVAVLDLATSARATIVRRGGQAEYIPGSGQGGHLVYTADGALRAVRFDPLRRDVLGDSVTVVENIMIKPSGAANYGVSRTGTLVYTPIGAITSTPITSLVWVDRTGREESMAAPPCAYGPPRLSPDGTRVAVGIVDEGNTEIWIWDFAPEKLTRLTSGAKTYAGTASTVPWIPATARVRSPTPCMARHCRIAILYVMINA